MFEDGSNESLRTCWLLLLVSRLTVSKFYELIVVGPDASVNFGSSGIPILLIAKNVAKTSRNSTVRMNRLAQHVASEETTSRRFRVPPSD